MACTSILSDYEFTHGAHRRYFERPAAASVGGWKETLAGKIFRVPEIKALWNKILESSVSHAGASDCFVLICCGCAIRSQNHTGLNSNKHFIILVERDEKLASWVIDRMKTNLREKMDNAADDSAHSESELRRLAGLQRIRGTVRRIGKRTFGLSFGAKPCWLMKSNIFSQLD